MCADFSDMALNSCLIVFVAAVKALGRYVWYIAEGNEDRRAE